jgi:hypothetical protein
MSWETQNYMLAHLIYMSSRTPQCTDAEIEKIMASSVKNNPKLDITGVLLYSPKSFVQYIEGELGALNKLYDKIKSDGRHKNTVMISNAPIKERSFPAWHMGAKKLDVNSIEFKTKVNAHEQAILDDVLTGKKQESEKAIALIRKLF